MRRYGPMTMTAQPGNPCGWSTVVTNHQDIDREGEQTCANHCFLKKCVVRWKWQKLVKIICIAKYPYQSMVDDFVQLLGHVNYMPQPLMISYAYLHTYFLPIITARRLVSGIGWNQTDRVMHA